MKLAWATDIHLDFVDGARFDSFVSELMRPGAEAYLLTGDIATADTLEPALHRLEARLGRPIYFVLGNHDYYLGSIELVRRSMRELTRHSSRLSWLPEAGVVPLTASTALVGHDGWGDARVGNAETTPVELNDFVLIDELNVGYRKARLERLRALGDEAARHAREVLPKALADFPEVFFLTHVPPFREACWYEGGISDDDWLPYFTCTALGEALREVMEAHPARRLTVLCGHSHGEGEARLAPNLRCLTGGATYGQPRLNGVFDVG